MNLNALRKASSNLRPGPRMPVLFLGHGSPMNAIEENSFTKSFRKLGNEIPRPKAILCVSAHWETDGTYVTAMPHPRTIHDFYGFPKLLYEVQYPAPGSPELAYETQQLAAKSGMRPDERWGLDHGAWSVLKHIYPKADIPVIQLSLNRKRPGRDHYELARQLHDLRNRGILIVGSGNMVHNLSLIAWDKLSGEPFAFEWATAASERMKALILNRDHNSLINYTGQGRAFQLAIPTPEHYLPLLYVLALQDDDETVTFFNDEPVGGSLTMTSFKIQPE